MRDFIIIVAVIVVFAVISYASLWYLTVGNREADLAECKVKATDVLKDKATERPDYVYNCMMASGYQHEAGLSACTHTRFSVSDADKKFGLIIPSCFYPDNFLNQLIRAYYGA
jgi:hypothetical protein